MENKKIDYRESYPVHYKTFENGEVVENVTYGKIIEKKIDCYIVEVTIDDQVSILAVEPTNQQHENTNFYIHNRSLRAIIPPRYPYQRHRQDGKA